MSDQAGLFGYRRLTADDVRATVSAAIADADTLVAEAVTASKEARVTFADVIGRLDRALGDLWDANGRSGFMVRVHPDVVVREAAQAEDERVTNWRRSLPLRDARRPALNHATDSSAGCDVICDTMRIRSVVRLLHQGDATLS